MAKSLSVFVVGIEASNVTIPIADTFEEFGATTIQELKKRIYEKRPEYEPDRQRLLFAGKQLEVTSRGKENTLSTYNIQKNSTLHMVMRLPGGTNLY